MKKLILAILLLNTVPTMSMADPWVEPEGQCAFPWGTVVLDPGQFPLACGPFEICIAWQEPGHICLESFEYQPQGCQWTWEERTGPEYRDAISLWYSRIYPWGVCVFLDRISHATTQR